MFLIHDFSYRNTSLYCDALGGGMRAPHRHDAFFLFDLLERPRTPAFQDVEPALEGAPNALVERVRLVPVLVLD